MAVKFTNNAATTLAAGINSSATSISVTDGSVFPAITGSDHFYVTFDDTTNTEIVKVTARSGNTLTVVRGQDDTTARAFSSGDKAELRVVAALLEDVKTEVTSTLNVDTFTSDGTSAAFTLSQAPSSEDNLIVFIEGVYQNPGDFTLSGTTLTLDAAPPNTRKVVAYHVSGAVSGNNLNHDQFTANGSTAAFTLSIAPIHENNTQVFIDGVYQQKDSYSVSGTTLTLDSNPANGAKVEVMTFTQTDVNTIPASFVAGLTEVAAVGSDHLLVYDATDGALKKALASDLIETVGATPTFSTANITNTTTGDSLLFTTTEDSSTAAPVITLKRNSSSPADGDYLGQLKFKGENDADQEVIYAKVTGKISDASDGTEDGLLEFALRKAGSNNIGMRLTSTDLKLINGTGLEVAGDVAVGTTSASVPMHIQNQASSDTTVLRLENKPATAATHKVAMEFWGNEGSANNQAFNISRIYGEFDGTNYSDARITIGSASGNGSFNDELSIKNNRVIVGHTTASSGDFVISNSGAENFEFFAGNTTDQNVIQHYNRSSSQYVSSKQIANDHIFQIGGTEHVRMDGTHLKISAATPSIYFYDSSSNDDGYIQYGGGVLNYYADDNSELANSLHKWHIDGTHHMTLTSTGVLTLLGTQAGYVQGALELSGNADDTSGYRGQGVYMHNQGKDSTWYMGTLYTDADTWALCRKGSTTSLDSAAAQFSESIIRVDSAGHFGVGDNNSKPTELIEAMGITHGNISLSGDLPGYSANQYNCLKSHGNDLHFAAGSTYTGYISYNGGFTDVSDRREKDNIETITGATEKVKQLRGVTHTWIDNRDEGLTHYGLIAQEVREVIPEVVTETATKEGETEPTLGVEYQKLVPLLIETIKELEARIETLENA